MFGRKTSGGRYDTLGQLVEADGPVALPEALEIVLALVDQVDAVHAGGHIHRAIGVDSVALDEQRGPQLGLAEPLVPFGGPQADLYDAPPELRFRLRVFLPTDEEEARQVLREVGSSIEPRRIDIYQLGALLAHLLTSTRVGQYLCSPSIAGSVAPAARSVIDRALGFETTNRITSCDELKQALRQVRESASQWGHIQNLQPKDDGLPSELATPQPALPTPHHESQDLPFERLSHFRILERIGAGGMGDVYKAFDETLDRPVAIKVLPAELARHEEFVRRFRTEATAVAQLAHPNVVPIYFIGQDGEFHFFAMQFVEGESLAERLRRQLRLPVGDAVRIMQDCLHGLEAAHRQGMIHRDIKPGNILIDGRAQRAMLADFGLVRRMGESTRLTATGMVLGTVDYIAPEQARGQPVDGRSDLYSLGVLLYQLLSGHLPFDADTPTAMLFQHAYEEPLPLEQVAPDVPSSLTAMAARLMAKKPEDRYQQCRDVLADLEGLHKREGASAPASEPLSSVILLPDFGAAPNIPASVHDLVRPNWWQTIKDRAASLIRARAPALVEELQSTEQRVDGAVAEYERRRDTLAGLIEEAEDVAREMAAQVDSYRTAAVEAEERGVSAASENERLEAQDDRLRLEQAAEEIEIRVAEQEDQLGDMRVQLAQVNARLVELRSQRDLLNARLKIARARLDMGQTQPRRRWLTAALTVSAIVVCVLGVAVWGPWKTDYEPARFSEVPERQAAHKPAVKRAPVVTPSLVWPDNPPPDGFPLPTRGGAESEYNFESEAGAVRVWLPAPARDWSTEYVHCYGALLEGGRVFAISWIDLHPREPVAEELPSIGFTSWAKQAPIETSFMLWGKYPATAHEYRTAGRDCNLALTFVRYRRVYQLRASIEELGDRPADVVRFFESFRLVGDTDLPPCEQPIPLIDLTRGQERRGGFCGAKHGLAFESRAPAGGRLVGLIVEEAIQGDTRWIQSLQPIHQFGATYQLGDRCGGEPSTDAGMTKRHMLLADNGYAVSGLRLARDEQLRVAGVTLVYEGVAADGSFDATRVYASDWVGMSSLNSVPVALAKYPIIGLHGFATTRICGLGVIAWGS